MDCDLRRPLHVDIHTMKTKRLILTTADGVLNKYAMGLHSHTGRRQGKYFGPLAFFDDKPQTFTFCADIKTRSYKDLAAHCLALRLGTRYVQTFTTFGSRFFTASNLRPIAFESRPRTGSNLSRLIEELLPTILRSHGRQVDCAPRAADNHLLHCVVSFPPHSVSVACLL